MDKSRNEMADTSVQPLLCRPVNLIVASQDGTLRIDESTKLKELSKTSVTVELIAQMLEKAAAGVSSEQHNRLQEEACKLITSTPHLRRLVECVGCTLYIGLARTTPGQSNLYVWDGLYPETTFRADRPLLDHASVESALYLTISVSPNADLPSHLRVFDIIHPAALPWYRAAFRSAKQIKLDPVMFRGYTPLELKTGIVNDDLATLHALLVADADAVHIKHIPQCTPSKNVVSLERTTDRLTMLQAIFHSVTREGIEFTVEGVASIEASATAVAGSISSETLSVLRDSVFVSNGGPGDRLTTRETHPSAMSLGDAVRSYVSITLGLRVYVATALNDLHQAARTNSRQADVRASVRRIADVPLLARREYGSENAPFSMGTYQTGQSTSYWSRDKFGGYFASSIVLTSPVTIDQASVKSLDEKPVTQAAIRSWIRSRRDLDTSAFLDLATRLSTASHVKLCVFSFPGGLRAAKSLYFPVGPDEALPPAETTLAWEWVDADGSTSTSFPFGVHDLLIHLRLVAQRSVFELQSRFQGTSPLPFEAEATAFVTKLVRAYFARSVDDRYPSSATQSMDLTENLFPLRATGVYAKHMFQGATRASAAKASAIILLPNWNASLIDLGDGARVPSVKVVFKDNQQSITLTDAAALGKTLKTLAADMDPIWIWQEDGEAMKNASTRLPAIHNLAQLVKSCWTLVGNAPLLSSALASEVPTASTRADCFAFSTTGMFTPIAGDFIAFYAVDFKYEAAVLLGVGRLTTYRGRNVFQIGNDAVVTFESHQWMTGLHTCKTNMAFDPVITRAIGTDPIRARLVYMRVPAANQAPLFISSPSAPVFYDSREDATKRAQSFFAAFQEGKRVSRSSIYDMIQTETYDMIRHQHVATPTLPINYGNPDLPFVDESSDDILIGFATEASKHKKSIGSRLSKARTQITDSANDAPPILINRPTGTRHTSSLLSLT